ncbi:MAG: hypothetical protein RLO52_27410 [Sandaracinaceae bacterium]
MTPKTRLETAEYRGGSRRGAAGWLMAMLLSIPAVAAGCGDDESSEPPQDAGRERDAGQQDAGEATDAARRIDSGRVRDAGGGLGGFSPEPGFMVTDNGDGTLTIHDTSGEQRFGSKPNGAAPLYVIDLSDGGAGGSSPYSRRSIDGATLWGNQGTETIVSDEVVKPGSHYSRSAAPGSATSYSTPIHSQIDVSGNEGRNWYYYVDWYNGWTPDEVRSSNGRGNINVKWLRWQHHTAQAGPYVPQTMQASTQRWAFSGGSLGAYELSFRLDEQYGSRRWRSEESLHSVSSAPDARDAYVASYLDGRRVWEATDAISHKDSLDPAENNWDHFKLLATAEWGQPEDDLRFYYDLIYLDDSWCRVFVSELSTWPNDREYAREIQIPTDWHPGSVTILQRLGSFDSLSGTYLWAADDDDNRYLIGRFE